MKRYYFFAALALVVAAAAVITQMIATTPARHDRLAEKDLGEINTLINDYYRAHKTLPASLNDVAAKAPLTDRLQKYTYKPGTAPHYQLCATFETKDGVNTVPPLDDRTIVTIDRKNMPKDSMCDCFAAMRPNQTLCDRYFDVYDSLLNRAQIKKYMRRYNLEHHFGLNIQEAGIKRIILPNPDNTIKCVRFDDI